MDQSNNIIQVLQGSPDKLDQAINDLFNYNISILNNYSNSFIKHGISPLRYKIDVQLMVLTPYYLYQFVLLIII